MKTASAVLAFAATVTSALPAMAADKGSWTGFQIGVTGGMQDTRSTWTTTGLETPVAPADLDPATAVRKIKSDQAHVGLTGGYDMQIGDKIVIGVQGEGFHDFGKKSFIGVPGNIFYNDVPGGVPQDVIEYRTKWDAAIQARLGVLVTQSTLLYATAGWAAAKREYKLTCTTGDLGWCSPPSVNPAFPAVQHDKFSKTLNGWTVGVGVESQFTKHWSGRIAYRYTDYGSVDHEFLSFQAPDAIHTKISTTSHTLNFALLYRF